MDWFTSIGKAPLANAPSGETSLPSMKLSAEGWRASTVWIDSAAASSCLLWIRSAWPRYAPAPTYSRPAAVWRMKLGVVSGNFVTGFWGSLPPRPCTTFSSAATWAASCAPKRCSMAFALPVTLPEARTLA